MSVAGPSSTPAPPPSADAATLPAGYRIHEYQIERSLGGGGFGITYLASDSNLQLPVAIKEYFPSDLVTRTGDQGVRVRAGVSDDAKATYDWGLERFLDEARALATFRHPNIVRVLRYFRENGTAYIVMEYESGVSLKRWVPQNSPLTQRALLSIVYPLLDGLEAVHKTGFLHRDIKPDNIYVRADGTPVLLDFGAARRVSADKDMTNIVSPGFAPFEQYHSQGNQGPWTDIYSLGAVMYWMTTGKKPMESAARVKTDSMLPASGLAESSVFGAPLLQAIDWALQPDEGRRPQTVTAFRAAVLSSDRHEPAMAELDAHSGPAIDGGHALSRAGAGVSMAASKKNLLCTIMFLDLVGYSIRSVDDQVALKKLFNELIGKALKGVPEDTRLAIDTGDGAAICFMGDPEEALQSALLLRDLLSQRYGNVLFVRIGLHMGPVRIISDINNRVNVVGDGINVAQRVMDFAQGNQVLVSRSYYDVISRITDDTADMFENLGQYEDKHGRRHEVYAVNALRNTTTRREGAASTGASPTITVKSAQALDPGEVHELEAELARLIGPLARVLVRKAQPLALNMQELRESLAPSIQETKAREAFVAGTSAQPHSGAPSLPAQSRPPSRGNTSLMPPSSGRTALMGSVPAPAPAAAPLRGQPLSQPMTQMHRPQAQRNQPLSQPMSRPMSQPQTQPMSQPQTRQAASTLMLDIPPDELAVIEHALSRFIGPMAKMLIRKEMGRGGSFKDFVTAISANVDRPAQREEFVQALKRALPKRQI